MEIVSQNMFVITWHEEKLSFRNAELCVHKKVCKLGLYNTSQIWHLRLINCFEKQQLLSSD